MPLSKRIFDLIVASLGIITLSPIFLLLTLAVRLWIGAPVLFRQHRPGFRGHPFSLYKFRTMTDARNSAGQLLPDAQRLKPFGKFLRSLSLDELPEVFNILRGEMSLVGPRPLLMQYLPLYSSEQMRRHDAYPGLTGWAQVNGRNAASWEERFKLDVWYVDHRSFWLDIKIILLTIWKVITRQGINEPGQATTTYFTGNKD